MFTGNLLHFIICLLPVHLSLGTTERILTSSSLPLPFRYLHILMRSPMSFVVSGLSSSSSQPFLMGEMQQSLDHICGPLLTLCAVSMFLILRSPEVDPALQV